MVATADRITTLNGIPSEAGVPLREISPPPVVRLSFKFWRWLPRWHRPYGCPDCRRTFAREQDLLRHLPDEHPRWELFAEAYKQLRRPRSMPLAQLWRDPDFRARNAAAVRKNWTDPDFRARNAAAVRKNWTDPDFRARHAAAVRDGTARYWARYVATKEARA